MKFEEMCRDLLEKKHKMAVRQSYPDLLTTIRLKDSGQAGEMLTYFALDVPQVPLVITKEIFESDDWIVFDDISTRFNIANFVIMPNAKQFLKELWDTVITENQQGEYAHGFTNRPHYNLRFDEAIRLGLITANKRERKIEFTDLGRMLVKTL